MNDLWALIVSHWAKKEKEPFHHAKAILLLKQPRGKSARRELQKVGGREKEKLP